MVTKISKWSGVQDSLQITLKIESLVAYAMPDIPAKFQKDTSITFRVILLTHKQTNKLRQKHYSLAEVITDAQARREPQWGPRKHSRRGLSGNKMLNFFKTKLFLVYFIFWSDGRAPKRRGAWGNLLFSTGLQTPAILTCGQISEAKS